MSCDFLNFEIALFKKPFVHVYVHVHVHVHQKTSGQVDFSKIDLTKLWIQSMEYIRIFLYKFLSHIYSQFQMIEFQLIDTCKCPYSPIVLGFHNKPKN